MPVLNGIFSKPIRWISDLQTFFGFPKNTGIRYIIRNASINKWAKYKPVELPRPFHTDSNWYAGDNGKCGLNFNEVTLDISNQKLSFETIRSSYKDNTQWNYVKPTTWFRSYDFDGYNHNSVCPFNTMYNKGVLGTIPSPSVGQVITEYSLFSIDLEGGDYLPNGNLKISDILYKAYDGDYFNFKDARLGVVILIGTADPFDESIDWSNSFTNSAGCIFISNQTVAQCEADGVARVSVPVGYFVNVGNYRKQTYQVLGGLFFGNNNNKFVPLPYDNSHYPIISWKFEDRGAWALISECIGWSQYPTYSGWNDVKWIYTEDMMAIRPISQSYLQLKFKMYAYSYEGTADIVLNSSNVIVKYSDQYGNSKEANGYVVNSSYQVVSSDPISKDSGNPTEVIISCNDIIAPSMQEGYEFHIEIYYQYGVQQNRTQIYNMDFRYTSNYQ